jgi:hypothetical protein
VCVRRAVDDPDGTAADGSVVLVRDAALVVAVADAVEDAGDVCVVAVVFVAVVLVAPACDTPTTIAMAPKPPTARPSATARPFSAGWRRGVELGGMSADHRTPRSIWPVSNL